MWSLVFDCDTTVVTNTCHWISQPNLYLCLYLCMCVWVHVCVAVIGTQDGVIGMDPRNWIPYWSSFGEYVISSLWTKAAWFIYMLCRLGQWTTHKMISVRKLNKLCHPHIFSQQYRNLCLDNFCCYVWLSFVFYLFSFLFFFFCLWLL